MTAAVGAFLVGELAVRGAATGAVVAGAGDVARPRAGLPLLVRVSLADSARAAVLALGAVGFAAAGDWVADVTAEAGRGVDAGVVRADHRDIAGGEAAIAVGDTAARNFRVGASATEGSRVWFTEGLFAGAGVEAFIVGRTADAGAVAATLANGAGAARSATAITAAGFALAVRHADGLARAVAARFAVATLTADAAVRAAGAVGIAGAAGGAVAATVAALAVAEAGALMAVLTVGALDALAAACAAEAVAVAGLACVAVAASIATGGGAGAGALLALLAGGAVGVVAAGLTGARRVAAEVVAGVIAGGGAGTVGAGRAAGARGGAVAVFGAGEAGPVCAGGAARLFAAATVGEAGGRVDAGAAAGGLAAGAPGALPPPALAGAALLTIATALSLLEATGNGGTSLACLGRLDRAITRLDRRLLCVASGAAARFLATSTSLAARATAAAWVPRSRAAPGMTVRPIVMGVRRLVLRRHGDDGPKYRQRAAGGRANEGAEHGST